VSRRCPSRRANCRTRPGNPSCSSSVRDATRFTDLISCAVLPWAKGAGSQRPQRCHPSPSATDAPPPCDAEPVLFMRKMFPAWHWQFMRGAHRAESPLPSTSPRKHCSLFTRK
jgi:hypothetical protein